MADERGYVVGVGEQRGEQVEADAAEETGRGQDALVEGGHQPQHGDSSDQRV